MKTIRGRFRAAVLTGAVASVLAFAAGAKAQNFDDNSWLFGIPPANDNTRSLMRTNRELPVLAVVGDISCQPGEVENGVVVEPTGEAAKCWNSGTTPSLPTPAPLCGNPRRPLRIRLKL